MRRRPRPQPVDVGLLLKRLGIRATREAPTKLVAFCPHPAHDNKRTPAWFIRDKPGDPYHATHCCKSCGFSGGPLKLVGAVKGCSEEVAKLFLDELRGPAPVPVKVEAALVQRSLKGECRMPREAVPVEPGDRASQYLFGRGVFYEQYAAHRICWVPPGKHRLADRVVVPYYDAEGRLASYAARAMGDSRKRYLAPSQDEGNRRDAIFGEALWAEVITGDADTVILCEGAFNALAAERAWGPPGWAKVAALAGSEPEPSQLFKLARFDNVVVATDSDPAGDKAWEIVREHLEGTCRLARARPPEGLDLDAMGSEAVRELLAPLLRGMVAREI